MLNIRFSQTMADSCCALDIGGKFVNTFTSGVLLSLYYNCGTGYIVSNKVSSSLGYYSCTASSSFTLLISTEYNNVSILSLNIL